MAAPSKTHCIIPAIYQKFVTACAQAAVLILLSSLKYNHVRKGVVWTLTDQNLSNIMNIQYHISLQLKSL
jgi:hypothetical protein